MTLKFFYLFLGFSTIVPHAIYKARVIDPYKRTQQTAFIRSTEFPERADDMSGIYYWDPFEVGGIEQQKLFGPVKEGWMFGIERVRYAQ